MINRIPKRVVLSIVLCIGMINLYAQRMNLSLAILCMTNHTATEISNSTTVYNSNVNNGTCEEEDITSKTHLVDGPFTWDRNTRGVLLGIFFWGYFAGQVPASLLVQKFGVRIVVLVLLVVLSLSTILVPLVSVTSVYILYILRILTGLSSAGWFPGFYQIWTSWAPPEERGLLIGFAYAGLQIGSAITLPITGALCQTPVGWPLVFYFYGSASLLYCVIWYFMVFDTPEVHPRITQKERKLLSTKCPTLSSAEKQKTRIPVLAMLTSLPVWAFVMVNMGLDWNTYTFLTSFPAYMLEALKFDFYQNAGLSSLPFIGLWIGQVFSGWISDKLLTHQIISLKVTRRIMNTVGMLGAGIIMCIITLFDCHYKYLVVGLLTFALVLTGCVYSGGMLNPIEITPRHAGVLFAASNSVSALTGFLAPVVVSLLTPDKTYEQWTYVFFVGAAIFFATGLFFLFFSSFTVQSWSIEPADLNEDTETGLTSKFDEAKLVRGRNDQNLSRT